MEAGSSVLVDKSLYSKRNNAYVPDFNGGSGNAFMLRSASQRRFNIHGAGIGSGSLGPHPLPYAPYPPPAPTYASLPNPNLFQHHYPPLLPLPMSKSVSFPSPSPLPSNPVMAGPGPIHSANKDLKKPRSSAPNPKKDPQRGSTRPQKVPPAAVPPARVPKAPAPAAAAAAISPFKGEKPEEDEGGFTDAVYALSPPPSSLPMPKFSLRPRMALATSPATCNAEAFGGVGAADAGASDDLRRLLRL